MFCGLLNAFVCRLLLGYGVFHLINTGQAFPVTESLTASALGPKDVLAAVIEPFQDSRPKLSPEVNMTAVNIIRDRLRQKWQPKPKPIALDDSPTGADAETKLSDNDLPEPLRDPSKFFEGDIMGMDSDMDMSDEATRQASATQSNTWPNGIVPWVAASGVGSFTDQFLIKIRTAMKTIEDNTCVRFIEKQKSDPDLIDYIQIQATTSCASFVGIQRNQQYILYDTAGCRDQRSILHELMHALGSFHEMARLDRDDYIEINENNIKSEFKNNFQKYRKTNSYSYNDHDLTFDPDSVMMYQSNAFAIDKSSWTIRPKKDLTKPIASSPTLTDADIFAINDLYNCAVPNCEDRRNGRITFNNKCYFISTNQTLSFGDAEAACRQRNGHLAILPPNLINVFFGRISDENITNDLYWVAMVNQQKNYTANKDGSITFTLECNDSGTGLVNGELFPQTCDNFLANFICEIRTDLFDKNYKIAS